MKQKHYDIVIIGSGAGGGTVASELAPLMRAGLKIAVLEWGPKFADNEFTGRELEMAQKLYFDGGGFLTKSRDMTLAFGKAYGGSTVVYTGTSLKIPEATVARWNIRGLHAADLHARSDKYVVQNNVHLQEPEKLNDNNRLFAAGCRKLGYRVEQFPLNLKGCQGSGLCNLGCPNAAKQGTHRVQLPAAEREGVEVITNCRVYKIDFAAKKLSAQVAPAHHGLPSAWEAGDYEITARAVVVCGGAVNSPALLLRSGLGEALPALGRYFTTHPALILVGEHEKAISNYDGHPKSFYCDEFAETARFVLETCMYFPFTTAKNLAGFGEPVADLMRNFKKLQMILVLALDRALPENRVTVDSQGNPVVHYRLTDEVLDSLFEAMKASAKIFFAAGAQRVHAPAARDFFISSRDAARVDELMACDQMLPGKISISSAHLMGGCRMGESPRDSVADVWGEVHGLPWLFVADSSLFPHCAEINPYLTIMAFADRVAERVREKIQYL